MQSIPPTTANKQTQAQKKRGSMAVGEYSTVMGDECKCVTHGKRKPGGHDDNEHGGGGFRVLPVIELGGGGRVQLL